MRKTKILIFCVPFSGHLNVIKAFIKKYETIFEIQLVITGWKNIPANLEGIPSFTICNAPNLKETDPALWTFDRVSKLLGDCLKIAEKFTPDLIIYDFFSLEGYCVGKMLHIPYWCSIPALIGPFTDRAYLTRKLKAPLNILARQRIQKRYGLVFDDADIELISDGLHLPGELNLLWSYPSITPTNFLQHRKKSKYQFVGNMRSYRRTPAKQSKQRPLVYFSFGTVIMDNLWNQQPRLRKQLTHFIQRIADRWKDKPIDIIFASQGKKIFKHPPSNWHIFDRVDQISVLPNADVFITHGGSNSFHEAVLQSVPMVAIPFFGDQPLVGKRIAELGIGINLVPDSGIDTKKSKSFLNEELVAKCDEAVFNILQHNTFTDAYKKLDFKHASIRSLIRNHIPRT